MDLKDIVDFGEEDTRVLSRFLCPDLHQCLIYMDKECEECGKKLEYIGDFTEKELTKHLGELQIKKFTNL